jgi:hypothetical protein
MARLRQILKGTRQFRTVEVPLKNLLEDGAPKTVQVGVRVFNGDDYTAVLRYATKYAVDNGGKPEAGNELYDYGKAVAIVAIATIDAESDPANLRPFFGASDNPSVDERASDVLSNPVIGRDTILFLAEHHEVWQNECSPQPGQGTQTPEEWFAMLGEIAAEGPLAFLRLSAASRLNCVLFTANLLASLPQPKPTSGFTAEPSL